MYTLFSVLPKNTCPPSPHFGWEPSETPKRGGQEPSPSRVLNRPPLGPPAPPLFWGGLGVILGLGNHIFTLFWRKYPTSERIPRHHKVGYMSHNLLEVNCFPVRYSKSSCLSASDLDSPLCLSAPRAEKQHTE